MEELKNQLIGICNNSNLSPEAIYFVVKDLWHDAEIMLQEFKIYKKKKEQKSSNDEKDAYHLPGVDELEALSDEEEEE